MKFAKLLLFPSENQAHFGSFTFDASDSSQNANPMDRRAEGERE